jgi:UDP-GlcNAc3NAcA epimerase
VVAHLIRGTRRTESLPLSKRILTVIGARPQFIKAAPVSRALREHGGFREILVHTGQHYDDNMSEVFFRQLGLQTPDHNLGVGSGSHGAQTGRILEGLDALIQRDRPDAMLVYGDTNSTLAGALAASKLLVPVAHVEAGLRSFNRAMPEEQNRVVADHLADVLFAPTATAVTNLQREGIDPKRVHLVGDVMYDCARHFSELAARESRVLANLGVAPGSYILATIHRAENTDDDARLGVILDALAVVSKTSRVVFPVHPRTRKHLEQRGFSQRLDASVKVIDPVGYLDMVMLEKAASLIVTDSGGVQKEAFFHGVPCVTLRDETEWTELVEAGWNRVVPPTSTKAVVEAALAARGTKGRPCSPYGAGDTAERIVDILAKTVR